MDRAQVIALIQEAARRQGVDPAVLLQIARRESDLNPAAKAGTSSASGLFQMTRAGWKDYGGGGDVFDPAANAEGGARMTAANIAGLKASGYPISPANVYLAHFSGLGGARKVLGADPSARVGDVLGAEVIKANPFLANMTVADMQAWADRKMADAPMASPVAAGGPAIAPPQPGALDQVAMGRAPSGAAVRGAAPLDLAAAAGAGGSPGAPGASQGLGMLAQALGIGGQQETPMKPPEPMQMPIPVGMRGSLVASILARGGRA